MKLEENLSLERCPYCSVDKPNLPRTWKIETHNHSGKNKRYWKAYVCQNCGGVVIASSRENNADVREIYPDRVIETFDYDYLESDVAEDLKEAFSCYSHGNYNAFASMSRRTVQSIAKDLGAKGKSKVKKQVNDLKSILNIEDDTFNIINQIIISGHDGAHPYLPKLSPERASILLELLRDIVYQLYIRKKKIEESVMLRKKAIEDSQKSENPQKSVNTDKGP